MALYPIVVRAVAVRAPKGERIAAVAEYLRILIVLLVLSTLVCVLFPAQWIALLYSSKFGGAVSLVAVFVLAEAVLLVAGVFQALLIGFDDISGFLVCTVAGQLLTISLTRWLVASDGGMGVGIAFLTGNAVILIATGFRLLSRHDARRVVTPALLLAIALGATAASGWWATRAPGPAPLSRAAVYLVACSIALAFLRPDERRWIIRPWRAPASPRAR